MSVHTAKARDADAIEAAACADLYAAAPPDFARAAGLRIEEVGGATLLIAPPFPAHTFNRAIGLGVRRPASERYLDTIIARFRAAGCEEFWIHWNPAACPPDVPRWLEARGFSHPRRRSWAKMMRSRAAPPDIRTALEVRASLPGEADTASAVICAAFGMPASMAPWFAGLARRGGWRGYVARSNHEVVGAAWMHIGSAGAWLGIGGVLPDFRRRGAQGALMALRIRDAIAAGCETIVTETGEPVEGEANPSLDNMYRCGFERVCSRLNYASPRR